jgi:hypothetical protein
MATTTTKAMLEDVLYVDGDGDPGTVISTIELT